MPNFVPHDYRQDTMVVVNFEEQIRPGTFEFAIHYLIEKKIDTSVFHSHYRNEDNGRPAYDPAVLLKIILFAYSKGVTSSREIQWLCETNILFKALSCDTAPHFTTIADFVSRSSKEIESVFEQVLLICHEQGLIGNELFAIDGCKMSSNAAKEWSGTIKELEEKRDKLRKLIRVNLEEQQRLDASEADQANRHERLEKSIETLNKSADRIEDFLQIATPRMGNGQRPKEVKSNITDNESAKMKTSKGTIQGYNGIATVDKKHQVIIDAKAIGEGQEQAALIPILESLNERFKRLKINEAVCSSGIVITADTGYANEQNMQYLYEKNINGYIPDRNFRQRDPKFSDQKEKYGKRHQDDKKTKDIIPASEFILDADNKRCTCPAGNEISYRGEREDPNGNKKQFYEGRLLQCRHCPLKHVCMKNPDSANHRHGNGRQVSFIVEPNKEKTQYTDWMKVRIDSPQGKGYYSHRMSTVEPVFGNLGSNKGLDEFSLRGQEKVDGQWKLYCLVHNIEKLNNYGRISGKGR